LLKRISADVKRPIFSKVQGGCIPPTQSAAAIVVGATFIDVVGATVVVVVVGATVDVVVVSALAALLELSVRPTASNIARTANK